MSEIKKAAEKTEEMTRKIWLAGLGAYGQGLDNLQQGYEKMNDQAREFFDELVARGEKVEKETKDGVKTTREKIKDQADKNKEALSEQFSELREKMSGNMHMPSFDREELVDELQTRITKLSETLTKFVKPTTTTKKAPAKKPAAKKTTTARKPAAKKTTASRSTTTKK